MRLIDADAFRREIDNHWPFTKEEQSKHGIADIAKGTLLYVLNCMPTIEPQRWIPCSETPDTDRNVFVVRGEHEFMSVCIGHYDHDNNQWYEDRNWFVKCLYDGLYWCEMPPLPEPYKEAEA